MPLSREEKINLIRQKTAAPMDLKSLSREEKINLIRKSQVKPQESVPKESIIDTVSRGAVGFSTGMAEALNPLAIPHSLEVLGRAGLMGRMPNRQPGAGLWDSIKGNLAQAEKDSVLPRMNIDQVASGIRTVARAPFSPDEKITDIFDSEMDRQKEFNNMLPAGTKMAGELTGVVGSLGLAAKDAIKLIPGIGKKASGVANEAAYQALKPQGQYGKKISGSPRAQEIGQQLIEDKIVTAGASFKDILKRVKGKLDEYGQKIGHFAETADKARARDSSVRGVLVDDVIQQVEGKIIPKLIEEGAADTAQTVQSWLNNNLKSAAPGGEISFAQAQKIKGTLGKTKAKFQSANDTVAGDAFQDVYGVINESIENGIEGALKKFGSAEEIGQFVKAKGSFRNLKDAEKFIEDTVARSANNRMFSLTDYLTSVGGMGAGAAIAGTPGAVIGPALGVANKLARTRGNQVKASFFDSIAEVLNKPRKAQDVVPAIGAINSIGGDQAIEFEGSKITPSNEFLKKRGR